MVNRSRTASTPTALVIWSLLATGGAFAQISDCDARLMDNASVAGSAPASLDADCAGAAGRDVARQAPDQGMDVGKVQALRKLELAIIALRDPEEQARARLTQADGHYASTAKPVAPVRRFTTTAAADIPQSAYTLNADVLAGAEQAAQQAAQNVNEAMEVATRSVEAALSSAGPGN